MSPAIFSEKKRADIRNTLLENGFSLIKKQGFKKTSVEEVAANSGIAKGTFYNFFHSKEDFVAALVQYKNFQLRNKILLLCASRSLDTRESVFELIKFIISPENQNLYAYLTFEEISGIIVKVPSFLPPAALVQETVQSLLELIPNKNPNCDWKLLVNYSRMISILNNFDDTASFYSDVLEKNIDSIIMLMVDEILKL